MTSDFYFTVTSWFPENVRVKPYSKHSGGGGGGRIRRNAYQKNYKLPPPPLSFRFSDLPLVLVCNRATSFDVVWMQLSCRIRQLGNEKYLKNKLKNLNVAYLGIRIIRIIQSFCWGIQKLLVLQVANANSNNWRHFVVQNCTWHPLTYYMLYISYLKLRYWDHTIL